MAFEVGPPLLPCSVTRMRVLPGGITAMYVKPPQTSICRSSGGDTAWVIVALPTTLRLGVSTSRLSVSVGAPGSPVPTT